MTRIDFYINASNKAEVARKLAVKALSAGQYVLVFTLNAKLARELDSAFWQNPPRSFVPHALCNDRLASDTPILIGHDPARLLRSDVVINLDDALPEWFSRFDRLLDIVGQDPIDKELARLRFRSLKDKGYSLDVHDLEASK